MNGVDRDTLVAHLDDLLAIRDWPDKSLNGLQVEGVARVERVALATDAAQATIDLAHERGADFLVVHHGLFWGRVEAVVGPHRARLAALLERGISLYCAHLPLDAHPELGNNARLADILELADRAPFGEWDGRFVGLRGRLPAAMDRAALVARLEDRLGARPVVLPFGPERIETVAVVSGAADELIPEAAAAGVDAFVTGETSHVAWHAARERNLNVVFAGHYATETLGVRAVGDHLAGRFGVDTVFLDAPTGL